MSFSQLREFKYSPFGVPSSLADDDCKPFNLNPLVDPLYRSARRRVMVVFEHVPTEDLRAGRLCSGAHGKALANALKLGREYAKASGSELETNMGFAVVNYAYFKTYHLDDADKLKLSNRMQTKRLYAMVEKLKPHVIIAVGNRVSEVLTGRNQFMEPEWAPYWRGHALPYVKNEKRKVIPVHDFTLSTRQSDDDDDDEDGGDDFGEKKLVAEANLLGYASRCMSTVYVKELVLPYRTEVKAKYVLVDTIAKFRKFLAKLLEQKVVSVDSETEDLSRVTNVIQTLQFAWSARVGYVLPIQHRDSPWNAAQLKEIRLGLRKFFGRKIDPLSKDYDQYLIGQNYKFDMSPLRHWLGLYAIYWPVWDIQAGEYSLDENIKQVATVAGTGQYGLRQIALNHGITAYEGLKFGKGDRAGISHKSLTHDVLVYCGLDVQVPFAIHELQLRRAASQKFKRGSYEKHFKRFVTTQMNNLVKIESFMEGRGVPVDPQWLRKLQLANGPLEQLKTDLLKTMRDSPSVQKANKLMMKRLGVPSTSLWGGQQWVLDLNKPDHKQALFFDVLKLEAVQHTKTGQPSINKVFLKAHAGVPEVAAFSEYSALEKLSSTYVNKVSRIRRENRDMKSDGRLRPSFGFTDTVTGRSNSYDPNLQQIPSRGKHAKLIKRLFAAPKGSMVVKMDYSAHEIRIWSVISGDEKLGALFAKGRELRQKWRATEDPKYLEAVETVGDIHKLNCQLFWGTHPKDVTKEQRDAVKALIFGSIYGMGPGTLAGNLGQTKEFVLELLDKFFSQYKKASAWLKWAKEHVVEHNYVYSPIGRRRNVFAHLYEGANALEAAVKRMGSNSPIQGWAADMGHTAATLFLWHYPKVLRELQLIKRMDHSSGGINVMVHDSISGDFPYDKWYIALQVMQWCATTGCMAYYKHHYGTDYTVPLEVEFELGADDSTLEKWDWSNTQLSTIIDKSLEQQIQIYPDLDVSEAKREINRIRKNSKAMKYLDTNYPILA